MEPKLKIDASNGEEKTGSVESTVSINHETKLSSSPKGSPKSSPRNTARLGRIARLNRKKIERQNSKLKAGKE